MLFPDDGLRELQRLQDANLNLQAYEIAKQYGPFHEWEGTQALLAASKLVFNLGAPDHSFRLSSRAWHRDKTDPHAIFTYAGEMLQRRGPLPALIFIRRYPEYKADHRLMSWWFSLQAQLHATLRDFSMSAEFHKRAVEISPDEGWVWTARSFSLEQQDRYDEALESARRGLELAPARRASVSSVAHYLTLLEKNDEALDLLSSTVENVENGWLARELADLQSELGMHAQSYATFKRSIGMFPMMEGKTSEWFYGGLSDEAYLNGDLHEAKLYAEKANNSFHTKILDNLEKAPGGAKRVLLDVKFLRQHHVTCAPATLSNIGRYWKKKTEHLELVEQICYDGTPSYKERGWAESNGWVTREFTLNWTGATTLLDRGVPLTLATVYPGGGHLQAIIGYDASRGTYLVRDPYYQRTSEFLADELLENQKANGPRVMALVPEESRDLLGDIDLFESEIYDLVFALDSALEKHDREAAGQALKELEENYPDHRLTFVGRWSISAYDSNSLGIQSALKRLLELYPDDVNLRLSDINISVQETSRSQRIKTLEAYSRAKMTDPLIWQMFGYELGIDSRQHRRALHWLAKSLRKSPGTALTYRLIADILWSQRRFEEAAELYRIASSINDMDEPLSYSYFSAMRYLKRGDEAIGVLADRFRRFGKRSGLPARSLYSALRELGRVEEGFEILNKAIEMRPADGELILFVADSKERYGRSAEADQLLDRAEDISSRVSWLRASAMIAQLRGEQEVALSLWREVLKEDPTATDVHESIAYILKALEGADAAKEHLRKVCRRFPSNRNLNVLRLGYLDQEAGEAIAVLRDLIRRDPGDIWSLREISRWYIQVGKFEKALESADQAVRVDPNDSWSHCFRGHALELLKRYPDAADAFKSSVSLNVDNVDAISSWIGVVRTLKEKREVLNHVWEQLNSQTSSGDGLSAYRDHARLILNRDELLTQLEEFSSSNRRSWFATSALIYQISEMGRTEDAVQLAREATGRFPLVHQTWLDLAQAYRLVGDLEREIEALETATAINPFSSFGVQLLTEAYQRAGRLQDARDRLRSSLTRMPFDNFLLGYLADIHWRLGERELAIENAKQAVTIDPDYRWAWAAIKRWADERGDPEMPVELARQLAQKKPMDIRVWITLADMLDNGVFSKERLDAIEEALRIDPYAPGPLAAKANLLGEALRFDEAIKVAQTTTPDGFRAEQLQFVEAGLEASRGATERSLQLLIELTETSPHYYPGWARLADSYRLADGRSLEYKKAATEMVRLAPREAFAFGYLAEACLKLDEEAEAREALEQAVILDPSYEYAVTTLFGLYLKSSDLASAERLVNQVVTSSPVVGLPIAVELAVEQKNREQALALLRELLVNQSVTRDRLNAVFEKLALLRIDEKTLLVLLTKICASGEANPAVGRYAMHAMWNVTRSECADFLQSMSDQPRLCAEMASRYIDLLAGDNIRSLLGFIDANAKLLAADIEPWSAVGYHLTSLNETDRALRWYQDSEERKDIRPWMLWNYSINLRRARRYDEAGEINARALELRYDDTVQMHLSMFGLSQCRNGKIAQAASIFAQINPSAMGNWERFFYDSLRMTVEAYECISKNDTGGAKRIVTRMIDTMIEIDPKGDDPIVFVVADVIRALVVHMDGRWFNLLTTFRLYFNGFGRR